MQQSSATTTATIPRASFLCMTRPPSVVTIGSCKPSLLDERNPNGRLRAIWKREQIVLRRVVGMRGQVFLSCWAMPRNSHGGCPPAFVDVELRHVALDLADRCIL